VGALALLAGIGSTSVPAKTPSCADQVIADWYDDGRIGKIYPVACYRAAIAKLPPDVLDYSNAKEEIGRALAFAQQGKPDPGSADPSPTTTASSTSTPTTTTDTKPATTESTPTETVETGQGTTEAAGDTSTDTSGPSSVPIPLLVLGGLAVLLLAAGSAGYLRRRMGGSDGGDGTPPTAA
jgi:cobalamin biosynthesis Mg chelatase CobN